MNLETKTATLTLSKDVSDDVLRGRCHGGGLRGGLHSVTALPGKGPGADCTGPFFGIFICFYSSWYVGTFSCFR